MLRDRVGPPLALALALADALVTAGVCCLVLVALAFEKWEWFPMLVGPIGVGLSKLGRVPCHDGVRKGKSTKNMQIQQAKIIPHPTAIIYALVRVGERLQIGG